MQNLLVGWQHILFKKMGHFILKVILKVGYTRLSKKCVIHNCIFFCPVLACPSVLSLKPKEMLHVRKDYPFLPTRIVKYF